MRRVLQTSTSFLLPSVKRFQLPHLQPLSTPQCSSPAWAPSSPKITRQSTETNSSRSRNQASRIDVHRGRNARVWNAAMPALTIFPLRLTTAASSKAAKRRTRGPHIYAVIWNRTTMTRIWNVLSVLTTSWLLTCLSPICLNMEWSWNRKTIPAICKLTFSVNAFKTRFKNTKKHCQSYFSK